VVRFIQGKRGQAVLSGQDVAAVEIASEMRSTLREARANCGKRALQEKGGQYGGETLEKLLQWGVISNEELEVMRHRLTCTYREIGLKMQINPSTAYRTVKRVHNRVKALHKQVSIIRPDDGTDKDKLEANAKRIQNKILEAQLSVQQWDIYLLLCKGLSNNEMG
jgi:DNA-binding CsgD family transcriptional regulator